MAIAENASMKAMRDSGTAAPRGLERMRSHHAVECGGRQENNQNCTETNKHSVRFNPPLMLHYTYKAVCVVFARSDLTGLRREDYPEREHSSLGFRRAQMAHSEAGGLKQELGEEKKKIREMQARCSGRLGRGAPWPLTVHPNGGNLTAPQGNGLQMYPFPPSYEAPPSPPSDVRMKPSRREGVSLQGHSGNLALEGIRTLTIRG
ncbi:hypothetical protein D5F01_LYC04342 [Larimichthys crocea]|uniref:Uncharacterized protein n=1 Tax=Larimichthys crocea TaxID=215358 RepID=A0A6G0J2D8_LARCR|nr:hypothetical protein D5F01_LYC04342 [Larimichthys crocea]